jgi:formamidopyrimidine-DNA glycosylase
MPEPPEVETARRAASAVAVGRRIVGVTVADDPIVFEGVSRARIRRALLGRRVRVYQARIGPRRPARSLSDAELDRRRARLRAIIRTAVRVGADSERFPRRWLFHRRWRRRPGVTSTGDAIRWETIAGRTTAWVPHVQR